MRGCKQEKYHFKEADAGSTANFLLAMLAYLPEKRKEARAMLSHEWLAL